VDGAAGEVVGEELLSSTELATGSVGWAKNRRRLPREVLADEDNGGGNPVARLHGPALQAGSWCRRRSFWPSQTARGWIINNG
jgi:hypothetical protein